MTKNSTTPKMCEGDQVMGIGDDVELLKVDAVATRLSVSRWTVYRLIWDNAVQSVQIGRSRRIVRASLDAYVSGLIDGGL